MLALQEVSQQQQPPPPSGGDAHAHAQAQAQHQQHPQHQHQHHQPPPPHASSGGPSYTIKYEPKSPGGYDHGGGAPNYYYSQRSYSDVSDLDAQRRASFSFPPPQQPQQYGHPHARMSLPLVSEHQQQNTQQQQQQQQQQHQQQQMIPHILPQPNANPSPLQPPNAAPSAAAAAAAAAGGSGAPATTGSSDPSMASLQHHHSLVTPLPPPQLLVQHPYPPQTFPPPPPPGAAQMGQTPSHPANANNSTNGPPSHLMTTFNSKLSLRSMKKHVCSICGKRFTRPSSLQTHTYSHTGEKPFKCDVEGCGRHFSVVSNLRRHKKIHGIYN